MITLQSQIKIPNRKNHIVKNLVYIVGIVFHAFRHSPYRYAIGLAVREKSTASPSIYSIVISLADACAAQTHGIIGSFLSQVSSSAIPPAIPNYALF